MKRDFINISIEGIDRTFHALQVICFQHKQVYFVLKMVLYIWWLKIGIPIWDQMKFAPHATSQETHISNRYKQINKWYTTPPPINKHLYIQGIAKLCFQTSCPTSKSRHSS